MKYIIVLGNRTRDIMEKRVNRALKEFYSSPHEYVYDSVRSIPAKMLLFSGGSSDGFSKPEGAIMMNDFALSKGVDKKFITIEDKSRTTVENLINCKMILDRNYRKRECFSSGCLPKLTICTSTFHIRRVIVLAKMILPEYELSFIHTDEKVSDKKQQHEWNLLLSYLASETKKYMHVG